MEHTFPPGFVDAAQTDYRGGFRVARRFQDPDDGLSKQHTHETTRAQLDNFIRQKRRSSRLLTVTAVPENASLYRPCHDSREIRVLEVLPADSKSPLVGRLHHVSLEFAYVPDKDNPTWTKNTTHAVSLSEGSPICYTALSYVWGAPVFDESFTIEGNTKSITRELATAIRHLRHYEHSVVLWVDQICINQDDLNDKESQIQLMGLIYKRAWNTAIWIGQEPDHGAFRALRGLHEATQFLDDDLFDREREYLRHPKNEEPEVFEALAALFQRPWFTRTWTIQEVVLSQQPYVVTGGSSCHWDDFAGYCVSIRKLGIFDPEVEYSGSADDLPIAPRSFGVEVAAQIWITRSYYVSLVTKADMLNTLVETRYAGVSEKLDKVYGVLGLCEHNVRPDYSKPVAVVYRETTTQSILAARNAIQARRRAGDANLNSCHHTLFKIFSCIDHPPDDPEMASWVPDWSKPRLTASLGFSSSTRNCFNAGSGTMEDGIRFTANQTHLIVDVKLFDTIENVSPMMSTATLSADDPKHQNRSLRDGIEFVTSQTIHSTASVAVFLSFCKTLVAGKDGSGMQKYPEEYTELLSLLCDETTGTSPTFEKQPYSVRQQKGRFTLANLKARSTGRMFLGLQKAYKAAVLNRRLCWTKSGSIGLVPRYALYGDQIAVVPGSHMPFILRHRGVSDQFQLVGECYVDGLMHGEAMKSHDIGLRQITIT